MCVIAKEEEEEEENILQSISLPLPSLLNLARRQFSPHSSSSSSMCDLCSGRSHLQINFRLVLDQNSQLLNRSK